MGWIKSKSLVDAYNFSKTLGSYEELVFPMPATKQCSALQPCLFILLRYFLKYISPGTRTMFGESFFFFFFPCCTVIKAHYSLHKSVGEIVKTFGWVGSSFSKVC